MIESFRKANYDYVKKIKELEETNINQKVKKKKFSLMILINIAKT